MPPPTPGAVQASRMEDCFYHAFKFSFFYFTSIPQTAAAEKARLPAPAPRAPGMKTFTMAEVAKHNNRDSAWFVCDGKVYDPTPFLAKHPGGAAAILDVAGAPASALVLLTY